jgi:hypothetical protein
VLLDSLIICASTSHSHFSTLPRAFRFLPRLTRSPSPAYQHHLIHGDSQHDLEWGLGAGSIECTEYFSHACATALCVLHQLATANTPIRLQERE